MIQKTWKTELRTEEKQIAKDMEDSILTDNAVKRMTVNSLFDTYIETKELEDTTRINYVKMWNNQIRDDIGNIKVLQYLMGHQKIKKWCSSGVVS